MKVYLVTMLSSLVSALSAHCALADNLPVTLAGQKNIGSAAAYSLTCEKEGFIPIGGANKLLQAANQSFSPDDALYVRRQFQRSIDERKIYSPLRDQWFDFVVDQKSCGEITKTIPIIIDALKPR